MTTNYALSTLGAVCTASSTWTGYEPVKVIDNDAGTFWTGLSTTVVTGSWLRIDLGDEKTIERIVLRQYNTSLNQATSLRVEYSQDGSAWSMQQERAVGQNEDFTITATVGRHWRFTALSGGSHQWGVFAIELWGTPYVNPSSGRYYSWITTNRPLVGQEAENALANMGYSWAGDSPEFRILPYLAILGVQLEDIAASLGGGSEASLDDIYQAISNVITDLATHSTQSLEAHGSIGAYQVATWERTGMPEVLGDLTMVDLWQNYYSSRTADLDDRETRLMAAIAAGGGLTQADLDALSSDLQIVIGQARDDVKGWVTLNNVPLMALVAAELVADLAAVTSSAAAAAASSGSLAAGAGAALGSWGEKIIDILDLLSDQPTATGGAPVWPGATEVTFHAPWTISHADSIPGPMDGVLIDVITIAPGQSRQAAAGSFRYKGVAWLSFMTETGHWEPIQQVSSEHAVLTPQSLARATRLAIYCKPGSTLTVRPWVINGA